MSDLITSPVSRRALLGGLGGLALGALAGCSGSGSGGDKNATLEYDFWDPNMVDLTNQIVPKFHAKYPSLTMKPVQTGGDEYWTRLQTVTSGGNPPDVFNMNGPNFELYASNGVLAPLDDLLKKNNIDLSVFPKGMVDLYTYKGKHYGIPSNFATIAFWYNKTLFDKAKVTYPDSSWTWDDVKAAAAKITDHAAGVYGIAMPASVQEGYYNTVPQAGGYVISPDGKKSGYDDPKTIEGLKYWSDFFAAGYSPSYQQTIETDPSNLFASGKLGMYYGGTWRAVQWKKAKRTDVNVTTLPKGPVSGTSVIHGSANVMSAKTKHRSAAEKLLLFMASKDINLSYGSSGILLPAYEGTQKVWIDSMPEYNLQAYIDELKDTTPYPISKNTMVWNKIATQALAPAWEGKVSIEQAAQDCAKKVNAELAKQQ